MERWTQALVRPRLVGRAVPPSFTFLIPPADHESDCTLFHYTPLHLGITRRLQPTIIRDTERFPIFLQVFPPTFYLPPPPLLYEARIYQRPVQQAPR